MINKRSLNYSESVVTMGSYLLKKYKKTEIKIDIPRKHDNTTLIAVRQRSTDKQNELFQK